MEQRENLDKRFVYFMNYITAPIFAEVESRIHSFNDAKDFLEKYNEELYRIWSLENWRYNFSAKKRSKISKEVVHLLNQISAPIFEQIKKHPKVDFSFLDKYNEELYKIWSLDSWENNFTTEERSSISKEVVHLLNRISAPIFDQIKKDPKVDSNFLEKYNEELYKIWSLENWERNFSAEERNNTSKEVVLSLDEIIETQFKEQLSDESDYTTIEDLRLYFRQIFKHEFKNNPHRLSHTWFPNYPEKIP